MYRKWYIDAQRQLDDARREIENFQAEVYEKEVVKDLVREKKDLEKELAVQNQRADTLWNCNETLTKALNNITKK